MSFPTITGVTITGGSTAFSFTSSEPPSIRAGSLLIVQGHSPVEINTITEDGSKAGVLDIAWPYSNVTAGTALIVPLEGALFEKVKELVTLIQSSNTSHTALLSNIATLATSTGNVDIEDAAGTTHTLQGWLSLESIALNKMQEFGLGAIDPPNVTNANTAILPGFYRANGAGALNFDNPNSGNYGMLLVERRGSQVQQTNTYFNFVSYRYSADNGSTWTDWYQAFTTKSVEYGSNANGEYWKYPDGKLECTGSIPTTAMGANTQVTIAVTYAAVFIVKPVVTASGQPTASINLGGFSGQTGPDVNSTNLIFNNGSTAQNIINGKFIASGRWK